MNYPNMWWAKCIFKCIHFHPNMPVFNENT